MKGKRCFGVLLALFIIFGLSLSVYSNANASVNIDGYRLSSETLSLSQSNSYQVHTTGTNAAWVNGTYTWSNGGSSDYIGISGIRTTQNFSVVEGNIYKLSASFFFRTSTPVAPGVLIQTLNSNNYFKLVALEPIQCQAAQYESAQQVSYAMAYTCVYDFYVQSKTSSTRQIYIGLDNNSVMLFIPPASEGIMTMTQDISIFEPITDGAEELNQKDDEDRDNIEQQSSDIESDAQDTSSDLSNASSNIFTQANNILGAFNTPATDCLISVTTGSGGSLQLNNMNICNMPSEMRNMTQTILTIVVALAVLLIGWNVVRTTLEVYNEILGG